MNEDDNTRRCSSCFVVGLTAPAGLRPQPIKPAGGGKPGDPGVVGQTRIVGGLQGGGPKQAGVVGQTQSQLAQPGVLCSVCGKTLPKTDFSATQMKEKKEKRKCKNCVSGPPSTRNTYKTK